MTKAWQEQLTQEQRIASAIRARAILDQIQPKERGAKVRKLKTPHVPVAPPKPIQRDFLWLGAKTPDKPTVRFLVRLVAADISSDTESLLSESRTVFLAYARHRVMWLARILTGRSLLEIGRFVCRDHTTVMHGIAAHAKRAGVLLPHEAGAYEQAQADYRSLLSKHGGE